MFQITFQELFSERVLSDHTLCQAAVGLVLLEADSSPFIAAETRDPFDPFSFGCGTRINGTYNRKISLSDGDRGKVCCCYESV